MSRLALKIGIAALAIVVAAGAAEASERTKKKKKGFFAALFGESTNTQRKKAKKNRRFLFGGNDDVEIITGSELDITRGRSDDDPEPSPGLGMGNLTYVPDKLALLGNAKFTEPRPADPAASAIMDALASDDAGIRVLPEARDAILDHYRSTGFKPVWLTGQTLQPRAESLLKLLAAAGDEGLDPANYLPPALTSFGAPLPSWDAAAMARLDIGLTAMAIKYARHASGGQFDPRRLSAYNDVEPAWVPASQALKVLAWSPFPVEYLNSLHPQLEAYAALKKALAESRDALATPAPEPIPDGKIIRIGMSDERMPEIRARLAEKGFGPEGDYIPVDPFVLDTEFSARLKTYQISAGVKASGLVGPQTIRALNGEETINYAAAILNNMERLRWLPKDLGKRHVFVNQPAFSVRVMDNGKETWNSRVIVGKPHTQTSVFHDEMETVVFNPSWGVPQSIIANEYLPKLRRDPGYLDRIGFKVVNQKGKVVSSRSVNWRAYGRKIPYGIHQPPGSDNALGELKFLFPNSHDIYMHDTPNRELFEKDVRAFSHGCVRVQNPREFAAVLLGWDSAKIDEYVSTHGSENVKLPAKVPVHLTYFTAWPGEDGQIKFYADIYGRDKAMENARSAITLAQR